MELGDRSPDRHRFLHIQYTVTRRKVRTDRPGGLNPRAEIELFKKVAGPEGTDIDQGCRPPVDSKGLAGSVALDNINEEKKN